LLPILVKNLPHYLQNLKTLGLQVVFYHQSLIKTFKKWESIPSFNEISFTKV